MKHTPITSLSVAGFILASSLSSQAGTTVSIIPETEPAASTTEEWKFTVAPYAWLTAMTGDMRIGNLTSPVDVSFKDTLDQIDMGFMITLGANYGKWGVASDFIYARFSDRSPGDGVTVSSIGAIQKQWIFTPAVSYLVFEDEKWNVSVIAGARITKLEGTLSADLVAGGTAVVSNSKTWADPIIGVKGRVNLSEDFYLLYAGTIGGFGANSDLVWGAFGGLGYEFNDTVSAVVGYRGLGVDYDQGNLAMDTTTHGPVLGLVFSF